MPINVTSIDNKFKGKKQKDMQRQREFDGMERNPSKMAIERFKTEPFQLVYQRMRKQYEENTKV